MEATGEESSLIILIISKAMLGMQVHFLWDTQHKTVGPLTMFWLNFWQGRWQIRHWGKLPSVFNPSTKPSFYLSTGWWCDFWQNFNPLYDSWFCPFLLHTRRRGPTAEVVRMLGLGGMMWWGSVGQDSPRGEDTFLFFSLIVIFSVIMLRNAFLVCMGCLLLLLFWL